MKLTPKEVSDIAGNPNISTIERLVATNLGITDVIGLDACHHLARLDLSTNQLSSLDGVAAATNLRWLSVSKNHVNSLDPLRDVEALEVLNASHNKLSGKLSLGKWRALKAAILNDNDGIEAVKGLEKLRQLDTLVLSHNAVASVGSWLSGATRLEKLSLSRNPLSSLGEALKHCQGLQELRVNHCQLTCLPACLSACTRLRILEAGHNRIAAIKDIGVVERLPSLRQLSLRGNPAANTSGYVEKVSSMAPGLEILDNKRLFSRKRAREGFAEVQARVTGGERKTNESGGDGGGGAAVHREKVVPVMETAKKEIGAVKIDVVKKTKHTSRLLTAGAQDESNTNGKRLTASKVVEEIPRRTRDGGSEEDDALDPSALKKRKSKIGSAPLGEDSKRTGVVKILQIRPDKDQKDRHKKQKGTKDENNSGKSAIAGLRGSQAARVLMQAQEGHDGGGALPGWD